MYRNMEAWKGWLYGNMEAWEGWLYGNMEAWGGMPIQKYRSMRRDVCTEIWKHEEGWL